jgi:NADPH-dependent curcumin reductase CurA
MADNYRYIVLDSRPNGEPESSDFCVEEGHVPGPGPKEFLVRVVYLSVDPYMRGLIGRGSGYIESVEPGDPMPGGAVGVVEASNHEDYAEGDIVQGPFGWAEYAVSDGEDVRVVDPEMAPISTALGVLGMPGMTAYFGLLDVGQPQPGDSVFVSGAAGAVGSLVGQIARIAGCRVYGAAGTDEKIEWLTGELGFEDAFNYKEINNYRRKIRRMCEDGVDVYFDNVGGPITDAVFQNLNTGARIAVCGQIAQYNATGVPEGPRKLWHLITKRARAQGFLVFEYEHHYETARRRIANWIESGEVKYRETFVDGLENAPEAFIGLFHGDNIGKMVVRVSEDPTQG